MFILQGRRNFNPILSSEFLRIDEFLLKSFTKNILYAKNGDIPASETAHDITNMFLLTKSALQLWFLDRLEIFGQEPNSSNIKNMEIHQMCWSILKTH